VYISRSYTRLWVFCLFVSSVACWLYAATQRWLQRLVWFIALVRTGNACFLVRYLLPLAAGIVVGSSLTRVLLPVCGLLPWLWFLWLVRFGSYAALWFLNISLPTCTTLLFLFPWCQVESVLIVITLLVDGGVVSGAVFLPCWSVCLSGC